MTLLRKTSVGKDAALAKGWWKAHQWLLLRRGSQLGLLALFLLGPWAGIWFVKGNLTSSLTLGVLPLTDPYVLLQSLSAGHWPLTTAITGAIIVLCFYALVGGRAYCSWVCPVNPITDLAAWLRPLLGIRGGAHLSRGTRYWILAMTLVVSAVTGTVAWEWINPVTMLHRGLLFGGGLTWTVLLSVFLFDLFVMHRGWCGRVCPVGAAYSLIGFKSALRVTATNRSACNDCADCYAVCPEPLILKAPLKGGPAGVSPIVLSSNCTNCGRCIDVCSKDVFVFSSRFHQSSDTALKASTVRSTPSV
ncbi:MAG: quinol dehydrogenase ferredoxin subunit NapH [Rhodoferax sp.]|nr:quinol dehydrogenase ferredoxin subunit NapH [Rhodoferax sp.]